MQRDPSAADSAGSLGGRGDAWLLAAILALTLGFLFLRSFEPGMALFANDGPLAAQVADHLKLPDAFFGIWDDLFWLGQQTGSRTVNVTGLMILLLGPYWYINLHVFVAHLILGLSAWLLFRTLGLARFACVLGAIAAALNMNFLSNGAWGLSSRGLSLAMTLLALAAVHSSARSHALAKTVLAGLAIGMSISEGGDNGAIFSLFVAGYAMMRAWVTGEGAAGMRLIRGAGRVALMAVCAATLAAQMLAAFLTVASGGPTGPRQEAPSREERWSFTTQWSLPKLETLRVIIPGLYGYRMDTAGGGQYWGTVGQSPGWTPDSRLMPRYSGAGEYAGVLVVLVAAWALVQARRGAQSVFDETTRRLIAFWACAGLAALLFAWGRHAPFYQIIYALPYFSTIRNPMKFMHPFHMTLMILFAYGLHGMARLYLEPAARSVLSLPEQVRRAWTQGPAFEQRWTVACLFLCGASLVAYAAYAASRPELVRHLTAVRFPQTEAFDIARFSANEVGLYVLFLAASVAAFIALQSGWFAGGRALPATLLFGGLLVLDLGRSNRPWIVHYNHLERYASNPVLDILRDKPHEHRVAVVPFTEIPLLAQLSQFYQVEWLQHHFRVYNIQSLDVAQESRPPADKEAYFNALGNNVPRYWQIANGRFLLGLVGPLVEGLNDQLAPTTRPFRLHTPFTIKQTGPRIFTAEITTNGPFAVIEVTNALPRAKLYAAWETIADDAGLLKRLADPAWDPARTVLVSDPGPGPEPMAPEAAEAAGTAGEVTFVSYAPRQITLKARAAAASILLLNDRYNTDWKVEVDGLPSTLLRCNYLMRGVRLTPGEHVVTFHYAPPNTFLYLTLAAVILGIGLCALVAWKR